MNTTTMIEAHYRANYQSMIKRVKNRVGGEYNAEDVVQETFARALRFANSYDHTRDFTKWINSIMNNAARSFKKDERNLGMKVDYVDKELGDEGLYQDTDPVLLGQVKDEIAKLDHPDRDIMHLYFNLEYTPSDIAVVVEDVSPGNIRKKIHDFKQTMRKKYA